MSGFFNTITLHTKQHVKPHVDFLSFENWFGQKQASSRIVYILILKCTIWLHILLKLIKCTMIINKHTRLKVIYWNIIKMGNRYSACVSPFLKHEFCFNDVCLIRFHILIPMSQRLSWHNRLKYFFLPLVISNIFV